MNFNDQMERQIDLWEWKDGWIATWIDGKIDRWKDGKVDSWKMDRWIVEKID